ncbi:MAG: transcriptional repressor LexA [Chloroflexi bacterium]|nr:transcriptional repressor LexA [Chloroflexota bacterium]
MVQRGGNQRTQRSLSARQRAILDFLQAFTEEKGYPPSIREIVKGCDVSSTSVVDYNLRALEREGYIRRDRDVSRGIELLGRERATTRTVAVPVMGQIAAGHPIPVPEADSWLPGSGVDTIELTEDLTRGRPGVYALRVKGVSMIDALINDGDLVLMEPAQTAENGETVAVWLRDEKEVTLKRFYLEGDRVRLQPANRTMRPIYVDPDNVEIQGRVIGVIRQL